MMTVPNDAAVWVTIPVKPRSSFRISATPVQRKPYTNGPEAAKLGIREVPRTGLSGQEILIVGVISQVCRGVGADRIDPAIVGS